MQDINNIREYAVVGSRQLQIVLLNYRIQKLADKLEKAQLKKWSLVSKNIDEYHQQNALEVRG